MSTLYLIIGKTCAGKDTLANAIMANTDIVTIVPYTTRAPRPGEVDGATYYFVDEQHYQELHESGAILEERSYNTTTGVVHYFETYDQFDMQEDKDYMLICSPKAAVSIVSELGRDVVKVINVYADDFIRLSRYVARESHSDHPDANEICRRFLDEANEHTDSDMLKLNIDLNIENNNIVACVNEFLKYYMNSKE